MIPAKPSNITKEYVFSKVTQEQVFEKYLQLNVAPYIYSGGLFCNPLREDNSPTCSFKVYKNSSYSCGYLIWFRDYADVGKGMDCISLVRRIANCNYFDAICLIAHHFSLLSDEDEQSYKYVLDPVRMLMVAEKSKEVELKIKRTAWRKEHIAFWKQFYLTTEEELANIYPIDYYWLNGERYTPKGNFGFAYHFWDYNYKIYIPYANPKTEIKFIHNNANILQGEEGLKFDKDTLIITSSYKDVKVLRKIEKMGNLGYEAAAGMSENTLPANKVNKAKTKYKRIILFQNNDAVGLRNAKAQADEHNLIYVHTPLDEPKDPADFIKKHGPEDTLLFMKQLLYKITPPF